MNTKTSYVVFNTVTTNSPATDGESFQFSIKLTTNLAGLIRTDSYLTVTFVGSDGSSHSSIVYCYDGDTLIDTYSFTGLSIPNDAGTNTITGISLDFDYLDEVWRNINFTYKGSITEQIKYDYVVS